ncbi:hypothetical protein D3C75_1334830 [compost metagenome]
MFAHWLCTAPSFQSAVNAWYSTPTPLSCSSDDIVNAEIKTYAGYYGNTDGMLKHHTIVLCLVVMIIWMKFVLIMMR